MSKELLKESQNEGLTIEKLRTFEGFEKMSDFEANELIKAYKMFSIITYNYYQKQKV